MKIEHIIWMASYVSSQMTEELIENWDDMKNGAGA